MLKIIAALSISFAITSWCKVPEDACQMAKPDTSLNIQKRLLLPILTTDPKSACSWNVNGISLVYKVSMFNLPHFALKIDLPELSSEQSNDVTLLLHLAFKKSDNPKLAMLQRYVLRMKNGDENPERILTAFPGDKYPDSNILMKVNDTAGLTLGRLVDCVDISGITADTLGSCLFFAIRVLRFATGDCECGQCGNENEDLSNIQRLSKAAQSKIEANKMGIDGFVATYEKIKNQKKLKLAAAVFKQTYKKYSERLDNVVKQLRALANI